MAILYFMAVKITSLIEKIVAITAPHRCILCGSNDNVLCFGCYASQVVRPDAFCALCATPSADWRLCQICRLRSGLEYVWVGAEYDGLVKQTIHKYKFERARAAYSNLARLLDDSMPYGDWQIVPIPTAANRIRQRGYDQTALLAQEIARLRSLPLIHLLRRVSMRRQVGANRAQRLAQSEQAFQMTPNAQFTKEVPVVLVDDVCTTGATLTAAAQLLKRAGVQEVHAVVCAWQAPQPTAV